MRVIQVYLPVFVTENVDYNGFTIPVLRYYERLVASHLAPILFKEVARSPWDKVVNRIERTLKQFVKDIGAGKLLGIAFLGVLFALSTKYPWARKALENDWVKALKKTLGIRESYDILYEQDYEIDKLRNELFTKIIMANKQIEIHFVSVPLTASEVKQMFMNSTKFAEELKKKAFQSLGTLEITDDVDILPLVLDIPCIACTIDEVEYIEKKSKGKYSMIIIDTVNEVVYTRLYIGKKELKYSAPLDIIIKRRRDTQLTLSKLATVLQGIKIDRSM